MAHRTSALPLGQTNRCLIGSFSDRPIAAISRDGHKLNLRHGPIDLIIKADGYPEERQAAYRQAARAFQGVLPGLAGELGSLRQPVSKQSPVLLGQIAQAMRRAAAEHQDRFATPMIAVAGAVADYVLQTLIEGRDLQRAFVNNGGDIALYLQIGQSFDIGICPNPANGDTAGTIRIHSDDAARGIATSGWRGRSHSLGIADAVTVLAKDAASADAAATIIANEVDVQSSPNITRKPARELSPDSDLADRMVTCDVGDLSNNEIEHALTKGEELANHVYQRGIIAGAFISLCGQVRTIGQQPLALPSTSVNPELLNT